MRKVKGLEGQSVNGKRSGVNCELQSPLDEVLRQRMGANGARYAREHLMWGQVVRELIRRYEQVLAGTLSPLGKTEFR